jgi:hypothetical protein
LPPDFKPAFVKNLNLALQEDILGQTIVETVVIRFEIRPTGGVARLTKLPGRALARIRDVQTPCTMHITPCSSASRHDHGQAYKSLVRRGIFGVPLNYRA